MTDEYSVYSGVNNKFKHQLTVFILVLVKNILLSYLDEFVLRFNTRKFDVQHRFNFLLAAKAHKKLSYKELIK